MGGQDVGLGRVKLRTKLRRTGIENKGSCGSSACSRGDKVCGEALRARVRLSRGEAQDRDGVTAPMRRLGLIKAGEAFKAGELMIFRGFCTGALVDEPISSSGDLTQRRVTASASLLLWERFLKFRNKINRS